MYIVTKQFVKKNIRLSLELDEYLTKNPELYDKIPDGAAIVIALKNDERFSKDSISIVMDHVKKHEPKQPIIKAEKARAGWNLTALEPALA